MKTTNNKHRILYGIRDFFVLLFFRCFSFLPVTKTKRESHKVINVAAWKDNKNLFIKNGFIENQPAMNMLQFGNSHKADYNGCEIIAIYNALVALGRVDINEDNTVFSELLEHFEKRGSSFWGAFGTSPYAIYRFFSNNLFAVQRINYKNWNELLGNKNAYDDFIKNNDAFIFIAYNNERKLSDMIHTMCITKNNEDFVIHNDYAGTKHYKSLADTVNDYKNGKGRLLMLIGVGNKD
jgi:uncharacterized protein YvpB